MEKLKKYLLKQICENPYNQSLEHFLDGVNEMELKIKELENYKTLAETTIFGDNIKIENQKRKLIEVAHNRNDLANKLKEQEKYVELGRAVEEALDENVMYISDLDESINISFTNELIDWYRKTE